MTEDNTGSDGGGGGGGEKKSAISLNENRAFIIGRVRDTPKSAAGKYTMVPLLIPSYKKDGKMQWVPVTVDCFGDSQSLAAKAKAGDYFRANAFVVNREVTDDQGDKKKLNRLQVDGDGVGLVSATLDDIDNPPDDGMCRNEIMVLGRFIVSKKKRDEGQTGPRVGGTDRKNCFLTLAYNDPRKKDGDPIWFDVGVFGPQAEFLGANLKHFDQVYVNGELGVREADFLVKGKAPKRLTITARPFGVQFVTTGGRNSAAAEPKGPDAAAYGADDDLPF